MALSVIGREQQHPGRQFVPDHGVHDVQTVQIGHLVVHQGNVR